MYSADIKYKVDVENRVVVAYATMDWADEIDKLERNLSKRIQGNKVVDTVWFNHLNHLKKKTYCGKSRCHDDDEFDEAIGKQIALKRCVEKIDKDYFRLLNQIKNDIDDIKILFDAIRRLNLNIMMREDNRRGDEIQVATEAAYNKKQLEQRLHNILK